MEYYTLVYTHGGKAHIETLHTQHAWHRARSLEEIGIPFIAFRGSIAPAGWYGRIEAPDQLLPGMPDRDQAFPYVPEEDDE